MSTTAARHGSSARLPAWRRRAAEGGGRPPWRSTCGSACRARRGGALARRPRPAWRGRGARRGCRVSRSGGGRCSAGRAPGHQHVRPVCASPLKNMGSRHPRGGVRGGPSEIREMTLGPVRWLLGLSGGIARHVASEKRVRLGCVRCGEPLGGIPQLTFALGGAGLPRGAVRTAAIDVAASRRMVVLPTQDGKLSTHVPPGIQRLAARLGDEPIGCPPSTGPWCGGTPRGAPCTAAPPPSRPPRPDAPSAPAGHVAELAPDTGLARRSRHDRPRWGRGESADADGEVPAQAGRERTEVMPSGSQRRTDGSWTNQPADCPCRASRQGWMRVSSVGPVGPVGSAGYGAGV